MGWLAEFIFGWIWDEVIYAIYKRYGFFAAALAVVGPILLVGLLIAALL